MDKIMEKNVDYKTSLLVCETDYRSLDVFLSHEHQKREEKKWKKRFWILVPLFLGVVLLVCVLFSCSYIQIVELKSDYERINKNCTSTAPIEKQRKGVVSNGGFESLSPSLQSQLLLSIPDAHQLPPRDVHSNSKPNIFVFLADDMGYGDLSVYGHPTQPWGPLDEMASKGVRFTQFYADTLCTPSRAQFLTGRFPIRSGMRGEKKRVFGPSDKGGLPQSEITIAEMLRDAGYATGFNGKWHLGINCETSTDGCHLPFNHGFQDVGTYFPLSNNLGCDESKRFSYYPNPVGCFLYRGKDTVPWQAPAYRESLTETLLNETKDFVTRNRDHPWFYYFASPQTHDAMYSSKRFQGSTTRGEYGDALNEMNWGAGEIVRHVHSLGLLHNTLFFFFSDNGGMLQDCFQGGNNGLLTGLDMSYILRTGGPQKEIDRNRAIFYYCKDNLLAVRYKGYKIAFATNKLATVDFEVSGCVDGVPTKKLNPMAGMANVNCSDPTVFDFHDPPLIFNLVEDSSERFPLNPSTRQKFLREVDTVVHNHRTTLIPVPNQLELGSSPTLIPCRDPKNNCVFNYPLAHQFDFSPVLNNLL